MKRFKFKLDALLKLREFNEKQRKLELGQILQEITQVKEKILKIEEDIKETYLAQDDFMSSPAAGHMLQFFPFFIKGKKEEIKNCEALLYSLHKKYETKSKELAIARGEVKVLENLKEKHHGKFKKELIKEENQRLEEYVMIKRHREKHL